MITSIYDVNVNAIDGSPVSLRAYEGKVLLIVNVASKCGLTPQYDGLEELYELYSDQGFAILGFPANDFAEQEPGSNQAIQDFCRLNFGVTFPMFEKIVVKGAGQHPLYHYLTTTKPDALMKPDGVLFKKLSDMGLLSGAPHDIKWNFEKFLISKTGQIAERFSPEIAPLDSVLIAAIEREIAA